MKTLLGVAIVACAMMTAAAEGRAAAGAPDMALQQVAAAEAREFSSRHRRSHAQRRVRHTHVSVYRHRTPYPVWRPHYHYVRYYHARPYHYEPHTPYPYDNLTPFFPFGLGYGLEPSW